MENVVDTKCVTIYWKKEMTVPEREVTVMIIIIKNKIKMNSKFFTSWGGVY